MDQQEHLRLFKHYFFVENVLTEIKKDLEKLKKIIDYQERYNQANSCLSVNQGKYNLALAHYNNGKLSEKGINFDNTLGKYSKLINELNEISTESLKKFKSTQCQFCQKKDLTNPYIYEKDNWGHQTVFCNTDCLTKWKKLISQYTCEWCKQSKSGQYGIYNGKEVVSKKQKKFCSEQCLNYWRDNQTKASEKKIKTCAGDNCSNHLTDNDISYCQGCVKKNDQLLKELEKGGEELKEMVNDFLNKLNCEHKNIVYEEGDPYYWFCEDCNDDSSPLFISKLQKDLIKDIKDDYFTKYNLNSSALKSSIYQFTKLSQGEFTNQQEIKQAYQSIEEELKKLIDNHKNSNITQKDKGNNSNLNMNREREREQFRT